MEPMQDKEFDEVIKQRFDSFEVEPSAGSWQKIAGQLGDGQKRRKVFPFFWMAAASVVVIMSSVLWLYRPVEIIKLQGRENVAIAAAPEEKLEQVFMSEPEVNEDPLPVPGNVPDLGKTQNNRRPKIRSFEVALLYTRQPDRLRPAVPQVNYPEKIVGETETPPAKDELLIALKPLPVVVSTEETITEISAEVEETRPRIKSIGGLVNFVIAQVDKRDDKIIEFKDGEEGSEVSVINLGLLKFKNRNR